MTDAARSQGQLREHFEIERELAAMLRAAASSDERRSLYGHVYSERSRRIAHHPLVLQARDPSAQVAAVAPQVRLLRPFLDRGTTFLEVGAGDGAVARTLAPLVDRATALDVTDALFDQAAQTPSFEQRVFDGVDLGVPDGSLDVVYSHDVVEHLHPDDMRVQSAAIRRALRSGGVYICVTPNRLTGPHDISRHFSDTPEGFHLHEYTAGDLAETLRTAGFATIRAFVSNRGHHITPQFPVSPIAQAEGLLRHLPIRARRFVGRGLHAIKMIAVA